MKEAERERLFSEARREDVLREVWDLQPVLPSLEKQLEDKNFLDFCVIFNDDETREEQSEKYWNHITNELFGEGLILSSEKKDGITIIEVSGEVPREDVPFYLDSLFGNRPIHFSQAFSLYLNGEVVAQTLSPGEYSKYFRSGGPYFFNVVRRPYEGRTSYGVQIGLEQMDFVKQLLLDLFCFREECNFVGVRKLLYEGSKGRKLAFERMVPVGREDHLRWRINGEEIGVISSESMFDDVLKEAINNDGICFYPKISQEINGIEVPTKLVFEMDPRRETIENAGIAFDYLVKVLDRLRIPYLALHSGSKSCRAEIFLDGKSIMEKSNELLEEFPFIGKVAKKSLEDERNEKERYKAICRTLRMAVFIYLYNLMRHGERKVNLTMNKFSAGKYVLFDVPPAVSIGEGSPKALVKVKKLRKYHEGYRHLRSVHYGFTLCTPIERYEIPKSRDDIYRITNFISAAERIERNYKSYIKRMNERVGPEKLREVFEKIPQRQFDILCIKGERKFKKAYPLA